MLRATVLTRARGFPPLPDILGVPFLLPAGLARNWRRLAVLPVGHASNFMRTLTPHLTRRLLAPTSRSRASRGLGLRGGHGQIVVFTACRLRAPPAERRLLAGAYRGTYRQHANTRVPLFILRRYGHYNKHTGWQKRALSAPGRLRCLPTPPPLQSGRYYSPRLPALAARNLCSATGLLAAAGPLIHGMASPPAMTRLASPPSTFNRDDITRYAGAPMLNWRLRSGHLLPA